MLKVPVSERVKSFLDAHKGVTVLAATKYADVAQIQEALDAGIKVLGENRVQDAQKKFLLLRGIFRKHFIGHLQTNKVRDAVQIFDCIESVDSEKLARKIDEEAGKAGKVMEVYLQVNVAETESQFGFRIEEVPVLIEALRSLKNIQVVGLMAILPNVQEVTVVREAARKMKKLLDESGLFTLSMGMSHDYQIAVEEGATEIRIGEGLFG